MLADRTALNSSKSIVPEASLRLSFTLVVARADSRVKDLESELVIGIGLRVSVAQSRVFQSAMGAGCASSTEPQYDRRARERSWSPLSSRLERGWADVCVCCTLIPQVSM